MDEKSKRRHRLLLILYAALSLAIMLAIFLMSDQPSGRSDALSGGFLHGGLGRFLARILPPLSAKGMDYDIRKYAHMAEYFALAFWVGLFFREAMHRRFPAFLAALLCCFLYACSDEFHQTFVPGRTGAFTDVLIDGVGYLTGTGLIALWPRRKRTTGV